VEYTLHWHLKGCDPENFLGFLSGTFVAVKEKYHNLYSLFSIKGHKNVQKENQLNNKKDSLESLVKDYVVNELHNIVNDENDVSDFDDETYHNKEPKRNGKLLVDVV